MISVFAVLSVFRAYQLQVTSFIVSDEYRYIRDALGGLYIDPLVTRPFFTGMNVIIFKVFHIQNLDTFVLFLPFFIFFWSCVTVVTFYKITKLLGFDSRTIALALLSSLLLISFTLLSLGFLTEPVSLALGTVGMYFLIWYIKRGIGKPRSLGAIGLSVLFFVLAAYTREPYYLFLIGGILVVIVATFSHRRALSPLNRRRALVFMVAPILIFSVPAYLASHYPYDYLGNVLAILGIHISLPALPDLSWLFPAHVTTTTASSTSTTTSSLNATVSSTSTSTSTINSTSISTSNSTSTPGGLSRGQALLDTIDLFFVGLLLGWGPILALFGLGGVLIILIHFLSRKDFSDLSLVLLCLVALGSYFVVAYLAVTGIFFNQNYLAFQHYSTIIRFTNTALPAYFLAAPFAFSLVSRHRKFTYVTLVALLVFGMVAIGAYQSYASSNLGLASNPFSLDYRTGGAMVRDYIQDHQSEAPFYIVGFYPETWAWTSGTSHIDSRLFSFYPTISESQFDSYRWSTFYVFAYNGYKGAAVDYVRERAPFLLPVVFPDLNNGTSGAAPYTAVGRQVIFNATFVLFEIQLQWNS